MTSIAHEIQQGVHTILQAGYHERLAVHSVMTLIHHIVDAWTIWAHDNPFTFNDPNGHVPAAIFGPSAQILRASEYGYHCALDLHLKIAAQLDLVGYTVRNAIEILKGLSGVCDAVTFGDGYIPKDRLELSAARQVLARLRNEACLRRYKKPESLVTIDREIESSDLKKRRVEGRKDHLAHNERKNHTTPVKMAQGLPPLGLVTIKPSAEKVKRDPEIGTYLTLCNLGEKNIANCTQRQKYFLLKGRGDISTFSESARNVRRSNVPIRRTKHLSLLIRRRRPIERHAQQSHLRQVAPHVMKPSQWILE